VSHVPCYQLCNSSQPTNSSLLDIDSATAKPEDDIPGFVCCVVNKDGKTIFLPRIRARRGVSTSEPMTMDSVFWIASCTKMIGGIACMQLAEQGKLSLDDAD
jgi:CubicO group peptidase (beta-lactamase class C family)